MGSKLKKNAILMGYINSFCLVCEASFDTEKEICDHIKKSNHAEKLLACPYLEKYGDNHIRKVKKGYYCEFCSMLLATTAKVSLHVQEKTHFEKKGTFLLRRPSGISAVIAFDDLLIGEQAWHSLSEDTCAICNEEFDNENIHKTESGHLLKLVQSKVEFGPANSVYRKTDDTSFQCLTCNAVFGLNILKEHFTQDEHKQNYLKCQEEYKKYAEQNKPKDTEKIEIKSAENKKTDVKNGKQDIAEKKKSDVNNGKQDIEKNAEKQVDKNHNDIKENANKVEVCTDIVPKTSAPIPDDEATLYAKDNNLTYNAGNTNAFCRICETKLPSTLRSMKEHVNGKEHKSRLEKVNQAAKLKASITKKPMKKFIDDCTKIENMFYDDVVINDKYCMSLTSFLMITKVGARLRCQSCEETLFDDESDEHYQTPRHEAAMQTTPVITSLHDSEFIREVRPGIFHCGYCNMIVPRWDDVTSHLQSREHRDNKGECAWRLQRHMPMLTEHRRRYDAMQAREEREFHRMMMGLFFRR